MDPHAIEHVVTLGEALAYLLGGLATGGLGYFVAIRRALTSNAMQRNHAAKADAETNIVDLLNKQINTLTESNQTLHREVARLHGLVLSLRAEVVMLRAVIAHSGMPVPEDALKQVGDAIKAMDE